MSAHPTQQPARGLAGRSAIVTGSTSGIGLGIAQSLAAAGANLMLNGFGEAKEIDADETTPILPGDVVKVKILPPPSQ